MSMLSTGNIACLAIGIALGAVMQGNHVLHQGNHPSAFIPKEGGVAVIFEHHFKKEKWAEARKVFNEKFYKPIAKDHKDVRDSFILENAERAEIVGVTLWRSQKDLDAWEHRPGKASHLHLLDPYHSRPMAEKRYRIMHEIIE